MPLSLSIIFIKAGMFLDTCTLQDSDVKLMCMQCLKKKDNMNKWWEEELAKDWFHISKKDDNRASSNVCKGFETQA